VGYSWPVPWWPCHNQDQSQVGRPDSRVRSSVLRPRGDRGRLGLEPRGQPGRMGSKGGLGMGEALGTKGSGFPLHPCRWRRRRAAKKSV